MRRGGPHSLIGSDPAAVAGAKLDRAVLRRVWRFAAPYRRAIAVFVTVLAASALLRGSYHLYQGFGGGLGNLLMGVVFALWWMRTRRLWPLVLAHTLLDVVAFLGYALLAPHVSWL